MVLPPVWETWIVFLFLEPASTQPEQVQGLLHWMSGGECTFSFSLARPIPPSNKLKKKLKENCNLQSKYIKLNSFVIFINKTKVMWQNCDLRKVFFTYIVQNKTLSIAVPPSKRPIKILFKKMCIVAYRKCEHTS